MLRYSRECGSRLFEGTSNCAVENQTADNVKSEWKRHLPTSPAWHEHRSRRPVLIADLHDFEIYVSGEVKARSFELIGLQHLEVPRSKKLLLDGFLNIGAERHYVEGVAIHDYSIEGYGDKEDPTVVTYAQSVFAAKDSTYDIWYRLNKPTKWYEQHHAPFLWVAQLAKHVLDFMEEQPRGSVCLEDFRWSFQQWLATRFPNHAAFRVWLRAVTEQKDFRVCVNAYIEFMYQQAYNLPNSKALLAHSLWADCMAGGRSRVDMQEQVEKYTLATPDVYECFKHMYFGEVIRPLSPSKYVKLQQQHRMAKMGFQTHQRVSAESERVCRPYGSSHVKVGDVVAISPKNEDKKIWRNADWEWFLHVQDVQQKDVGAQRLMGMWLYRPCETTIFAAKYKYENELFYSDHCNCDDGDLLSTDANGRYDIEWAPAFIPSKAFFVRQTHVTQDSSFVTYSEKHKICACKKQEVPSYDCGDTVYITKHLGTRRVLEPVIIHQKNERTAEYTVRRLARLGRDLAEQLKDIRHGDLVATNELVLTDAYEKVTASQIERRCHVRFVTKDDIINSRISFPYNLNGKGDFWYVSMGLLVGDEQTRLMYLARPPRYSKQGQDLDLGSAVKKLCGLSLFGGGGSFDRGIEEGGGVEVQYVVEWDAAAMHTQRANARNPKEQRLWCGSVDDHLREALEGCTNELVPDIGRVNIIIAGSPCPGM
jgi:DNA (cytosine-5)-methyltransferase 1